MPYPNNEGPDLPGSLESIVAFSVHMPPVRSGSVSGHAGPDQSAFTHRLNWNFIFSSWLKENEYSFKGDKC